MKKFLHLFLIFFVFGQLFSHPHLFVDLGLKLEARTNGVSQFNLQWTFDEMNSSFIIEEYDLNKNGKFDDNEQSAFHADLNRLRDMDGFPYIFAEKAEFSVESLTASIKNHRVLYQMPIKVKPNQNSNSKGWIFCDPTMFSSFALDTKDIEFKGNSEWVPKITANYSTEKCTGYLLEIKQK
jgi:ABC-type uncharacterized transport system substrate-binding protein